MNSYRASRPGRRCRSTPGPETCATLHMWTQIVGKIRLRESAPINHGWHSTLYVTARGLTTSPIPHGLRTFQIDFDFIDSRARHRRQRRADRASVALEPQTVASFYRRVMDALGGFGYRRAHLCQPERGARSDSLRSRRGAPRPTTRQRSTVLARARAERSRVQAVSLGLHRQVQPGALLLGRARPRRDAILRPAGRQSIPAASPTCPIASRARRTRTKSAAAGSGPAAGRSRTRRTTPTRIPSRPGSPALR